MATRQPVSVQPAATKQRDVSDFVIAQLGLWGVQQVFGVQGETIFGLLDAIRKQDAVKYVETRQEIAAAFMASAYAKLTNHLGVCTGSAGPGVTGLLPGLYDAQTDGAPVLALCGQVARGAMGRGAYQSIDQHALFETASYFNHDLMNPSQTPEFVMLAAKAALERHGVARLAIPSDVSRESVSGRLIGPNGHLTIEPVAAPAQRIAEAVEVLSGAARPVIVAGWGARACRSEVLRCSELFDAPIVTTCRAKGLIPDQEPLNLGVVGAWGTSPANAILQEADAILVVGSSLSQITTRGWTLIPSDAEIIQIDTDPRRIGRNHRVTFPLIGDAFLTLRQIVTQAQPVHHPEFHRKADLRKQDWIADVDRKANSDATPILPQRVIRDLSHACADDAVIAVDNGDHAIYFFQQFQTRNQSVVMSAHMGATGYGLPAANAAQIAYPGRQVICLCGDDGFTATMSEFLTACQYHLPITVVMLNNQEIGKSVTEQIEEHFANPGFFTKLHDVDAARLAQLCGGIGERVKNPNDIRPSIEKALSTNAPAIVQIDVDPNEHPIQA